MDREYFTNLTNDLYRLTLLFPKKEPLKYKMRDLADNILACLIMILEGDEKRYEELVYEIKKNIRPLDGFCEVAKKQNWVSEEDIDDVQERYEVIREEMERFERENLKEEEEKPKKKRVEVKVSVPCEAVLASTGLNPRQKKIVEILKEKEKIQVNEVQTSFPAITKRTLRRDFDALTKMGLVKRMGKANMTFYGLADNHA